MTNQETEPLTQQTINLNSSTVTKTRTKIRNYGSNKQLLNQFNKYNLIFQQEQSKLKSCNNVDVEDNILTSLDGLIPKIPPQFAHLINDTCEKEVDEIKMEPCDCGGSSCPHEQDAELTELIQSIKFRVSHLCHIDHPCKQDIFNILYQKIQDRLRCGNTKQDPSLAVTHHDCHVDRYAKKLLNIKDNHKEIGVAKQAKLEKFQKLIINLSFVSNILLLVIKIIAFVLTQSMILLASAMDSSCDVLSGLILFALIKVSRRGVQHGEYQDYINEMKPIQFMYCQRYESLGVLCFSCIMATLSAVLIAQSVSSIIAVASGKGEPLEIDVSALIILGITILVKLSLFIMCFISNKMQQKDAIQAYQDDHRNDVISNIFGLLGIGLLTLNTSDPLMGLIDPIFCVVICIYIIWNWIGTAIEQMKCLVGTALDQDQADEFMLRLLHQFVCINKIHSVKNIIGYTSGSKAVLEVYIVLSNNLSLEEAHDVGQSIQDEFEQLDSVERCYVHVETPCSHLH